MPQFPVSFTGFDAKIWTNLLGNQVETCSWAALVHAAATVGRKNSAHVMRHGAYSWLELVYRVTMVLANIRETRSGALMSTRAYSALDPSEKGAVSYFLSLAIAKLLAQERLGVPWLIHFDVYKDTMTIRWAAGSRRRPDLIGFDALGQCVVVECKGRSGRLPQTLMESAKDQARSVDAVNGAAPFCRIGSLIGFDGRSLYCEFADPPSRRKKNGTLIILSQDEFLRRYFRTIERAIATEAAAIVRRNIDGVEYDCVRLRSADADIGIHSGLRERLQNDTPLTAGAVGELLQVPRGATNVRREVDELSHAGADGIAVWLGPSWSSASMQLELAERDVEA